MSQETEQPSVPVHTGSLPYHTFSPLTQLCILSSPLCTFYAFFLKLIVCLRDKALLLFLVFLHYLHVLKSRKQNLKSTD